MPHSRNIWLCSLRFVIYDEYHGSPWFQVHLPQKLLSTTTEELRNDESSWFQGEGFHTFYIVLRSIFLFFMRNQTSASKNENQITCRFYSGCRNAYFVDLIGWADQMPSWESFYWTHHDPVNRKSLPFLNRTNTWRLMCNYAPNRNYAVKSSHDWKRSSE